MTHDAVEVISAKRDKGELSDSQIDWVMGGPDVTFSGTVVDQSTNDKAPARRTAGSGWPVSQRAIERSVKRAAVVAAKPLVRSGSA